MGIFAQYAEGIIASDAWEIANAESCTAAGDEKADADEGKGS
jgi:hypothetical protein